jgi:hypothetical protein
VCFIGHSIRFLPDLCCTGRMSIRIAAGALGALGPGQDLLCSPSHAFLIDGLLVEVQALINGSTLAQLQSWEECSFTFYSIELEQHNLVSGNGLLAETYFANVRSQRISRDAWDNYADYLALYGDSLPMAELPYPRVPFARQLPAAVRQRLATTAPVPA